MLGWLAVALWATSWLWGLHYFTPAQPVWWLAAFGLGLVCMAWTAVASSRRRPCLSSENWMSDVLPRQSFSSGSKTSAPLGPEAFPEAPASAPPFSVPAPPLSPPVSFEGLELPAACRFPKGLAIATFLLLLLPAWYWPWPWKGAPLAMLLGLLGVYQAGANRLVGRFWAHGSRAALIAGSVLFLQALALEAYLAQTARSHELPGWLRPLAVATAKFVDSEAADTGADLVFRVLGNPHRIGTTWEWFLDPATALFFAGGMAWLAWNCLEGVPAGRRWSCWLKGFRRLTGLVLLWLPLRWMLVLGLYLHRAALEGASGEPLAISQMFSSWVDLGFLIGPVLLAGWLLRGFPWAMVAEETPPAEKSAHSKQAAKAARSQADSRSKASPSAQGVGFGSAASSTPKSSSPGVNTSLSGAKLAAGENPLGEGTGSGPTEAYGGKKRLWAALAWVGVGAAVVSAAAVWTPIGRPKQGRVLVVERHSQWEPTLRPYDTTWYGEPSGYNYRAIYDYCSHFFEMGRILESEPINDQRLEDCDVLIIKIPTAPYSSEEIEAVHRFVDRGGGLLLIGDHTNVFRSSTYLNDITRPMGFTFRHDLLFCIGSPYDQAYRRQRGAHPAVQHVSEMDFAVSCSIDPGASWGRAAMRGTGLWSLPAAYEASNYHPHAQYFPHLRAGAFVQLWAASYGRGRVLAFTDSTIFSNFCIFQPGKAELFLNMLQWLNHTSLFDPWFAQVAITCGLGVMGLVLVGVGLSRAYPPSESSPCPESAEGFFPKDGALPKALALTAAALAGGTVAWAALSTYNHWAMPSLQPHTPYRLAVIDRTVSQTPLAKGAFNQSPEGFGLLEHTIPRLGYFTTRAQGGAAFQGEVLVVLEPTRSAPHRFREELLRYVSDGGCLLVIDSPDNPRSTANSLLEPFGLQIHHGPTAAGSPTLAGGLTVAGRSTGVSVERSCMVSGGEGLVYVGETPVAARTRYGKGTIAALGFGHVFTDGQMHPEEWRANWMPDPPAQMLARYELFYALFRAVVEPGPIQPPEKTSPRAPTPEAPEAPEVPHLPARPSSPAGPAKRPLGGKIQPLPAEKLETPEAPPVETGEKTGPSLPQPSGSLRFPKAAKPYPASKPREPSPEVPEAPDLPKTPR